MDASAECGITLRELRAVGGGSKSDAWLQISADILGRAPGPHPGIRGRVPGRGDPRGHGNRAHFARSEEGVRAMVCLGERFEPDAARQRLYAERFEKYRALWPLMKDYLRT